MRIERLILTAYGRCSDVGIDIGAAVTVVLGANEAGKSTSLDALNDFLWGIPTKTPRASDFTRPQLRIDAVLALEGGSRTVVRKSTGLFAEDLATDFPAAWNPENRLTSQWWRTRLGIDHAGLIRGGAEVFAGTGDLADIIFAAREGRSAREVLKEIADQADKLFKSDGRSKKVQLRLAVEKYKHAVSDRDSRLTLAGTVLTQRDDVRKLEDKYGQLRAEATATSQALKREEENARVIGAVLQLRQAGRQLEAIDDEGDRLSPSELADFDNASAERRHADERITKLNKDIDSKTAAVEALVIDDRLLDDRATFNRLQPDVKVRIEDLRRASEEFGVAVAEAERELRDLLESIGIEAGDDLDAAIVDARIRDDHAATLNDVAERIDGLEQKRLQAYDELDSARHELLGKGITVDIAAAAAPDEEALGVLRKAVIQARTDETKAETLLDEAAEAVQVLQSSAAGPHAGAVLTHDAVVDARNVRDAQWSTVRRSWVSGDLPAPPDRVDIAAEFDTWLAAADAVADDEAAERSRVAALDSRAELQIESLEAARQKQRDAAASLESAVEDRRTAEREWAAAWTNLGVANAPDVDNSAAVVGLLITAHSEHARERAAAERLAEVNEDWCAAAELAGLPVSTTCAAWRKRAEVLEAIAALEAQRAKERKREAQARGNWEGFVAEAVELLQRHEAIDEGQQVTPAVIEQGFAKLGRELAATTESSVKRATYLEQVAELSTERDDLLYAQQDAAGVLRRLVDEHAVDSEQDLDILSERARRAAEPLEQQRESMAAIKSGLGPGSDLQDVVERLSGHDEVTVGQAVQDAQARDQEARHDADQVLGELTLERQRLKDLEEAAGAAEAEAAVAAQQAEVARLAEAWAVLALQRKLLEDVLENIGSGDTRPLLDHAGRLLEELTEGRWVALRAEDDGASRKLQVIRADNTPCDPSQLSEGTADQVFFALRLAAVAELHDERMRAGEVALPLVLDDVLMAFDEERVRRALKILPSLAPGLQIIVFTHHQHVADAAAEVGEITVSCLPTAAAIADPLDGDLVRAQAQQGAAVTSPC